ASLARGWQRLTIWTECRFAAADVNGGLDPPLREPHGPHRCEIEPQQGCAQSPIFRNPRRERQEADRSLLLADAERLEDYDYARGVRACLHDDPGRHLQGRSVQAPLPGNLS